MRGDEDGDEGEKRKLPTMANSEDKDEEDWLPRDNENEHGTDRMSFDFEASDSDDSEI